MLGSVCLCQIPVEFEHFSYAYDEPLCLLSTALRDCLQTQKEVNFKKKLEKILPKNKLGGGGKKTHL